jgi:hypothetical protein
MVAVANALACVDVDSTPWSLVSLQLAFSPMVVFAIGIENEAQRPAIISFMVDAMMRFEKSLAEPLVQIQKKLRAKAQE